MLKIYDTTLELLRDVRGYADAIGRHDRDLARQLRRASTSVLLNLAEGSGGRGGTRRARYDDALGSARETLAALEGAAALGYVGSLRPSTRGQLNRIIGTLVRVQHR